MSPAKLAAASAGLVELIATATGIPTNASTIPPEANPPGDNVTFPYAVVHQIPSNDQFGTLTEPWRFDVFHFDVWVVGRNTEQAQAGMDLVVAAVVDSNVLWPAGADFDPAPAERSFRGWNAPQNPADQRLAWVSAEFGIAILT